MAQRFCTWVNLSVARKRESHHHCSGVQVLHGWNDLQAQIFSLVCWKRWCASTYLLRILLISIYFLLYCSGGLNDIPLLPKLLPKIQPDYLLWHPKLLTIDDRILKFHFGRLGTTWIIGDLHISIIKLAFSNDFNGLQIVLQSATTGLYSMC